MSRFFGLENLITPVTNLAFLTLKLNKPEKTLMTLLNRFWIGGKKRARNKACNLLLFPITDMERSALTST